jgi:hypothetical protein
MDAMIVAGNTHCADAANPLKVDQGAGAQPGEPHTMPVRASIVAVQPVNLIKDEPVGRCQDR